MNLINSSYAKAIVAAIGMILLVLNSLLGASAGLNANAQNYISLAIAILTPIAAYLQPNANTTTLSPGQVVVHATQVLPGVTPAVVHKP